MRRLGVTLIPALALALALPAAATSAPAHQAKPSPVKHHPFDDDWTGGVSLTHIGEDVTYVRGWKVAVATGDYRTSVGSSLTRDGGATWTRVSDLGYHVIDCVAKVCWAAGSKGRVGRG